MMQETAVIPVESTLGLLQKKEHFTKRNNCFSFVYWALGIDEEESRFMISPSELYKSFEVVTSAVEADAIGVQDATEGGRYEHLAMIDPQDSDYVIHRVNAGKPIIRESLVKFINERSQLRNERAFIFLKKV